METTTDAVLSLADEYGYLLTDDVRLICREHGVSADEAFKELGDSATFAGDLLSWLGY